MPIALLSVHLVNKIAAGEVIERPASVVKELVENAIDAGATRIDIAVEQGGAKLISVSDNGCGMDSDDLAMAFVPHATSQIQKEEDPFAIGTMGFRGEALAAIASVSHAHIRTCRLIRLVVQASRLQSSHCEERAGETPAPQSVGGHEIEASGESIGQVRPCAAADGTTITIRDLFFNTPARRKFMRTVNTELGHISEQVTRLALPHPNIAFSLTHNNRQVLKLPAADSTRERSADLFGREAADAMLTIQPRGGAVGVAGLLGKPSAARASGQWQYFFLNGRYIRDRLLNHALKEAYRGLIDPSRFPMALVFLTIDPAEVDVNVHPTKVEVRFRDGQSVHGHLLAALRETLSGANLTARAVASPEAAGLGRTLSEAERSPEQLQRQQSVRAAMAEFFRAIPPPQPRFSFPEPTPGRPVLEPKENCQTAIPLLPQGASSTTIPLLPQGASSQVVSSTAGVPPLMQIHDSYIVTACEDGLLIIDQHALHERVLYNELKVRLSQGHLPGQRMLMPAVVAASASAAAGLLARTELLARMGIEVEAFGPTSIAVQQFPSLLVARGVTPEEFIKEVMDKLAEDETADSEHLLENLLQMLACKAAIKAGTTLSQAEMLSLLAHRETAEKAAACPHGRPTVLKMTLRDLEKQFKRS